MSAPRPEPVAPTMSRAQEMLLDFLREHDAACSVCGYNLRALTRPVCPECRQDLTLTVGAARVRFGWLLVALAPGFFSGIAACFVAIPTVGAFIEDGVFFRPFVGAVLFGWCSGALSILLAVNRTRFIARSRSRQRWIALGIWLAHAAALGLFLLDIAPHFS
jgi:hypothetical protein